MVYSLKDAQFLATTLDRYPPLVYWKIIRIPCPTRLTLEQQTAEVYKAIEEKLNTAAAQRDENIKKMLERLREHVSDT